MASRRSPDAPRSSDSIRTLSPAPSRAARTRKADSAATGAAALTPEVRRAMIAESAYLRAERRGFVPGQETEDWLAAEAEVDALWKLSHGGSPQ